jgi:hypothetical protein
MAQQSNATDEAQIAPVTERFDVGDEVMNPSQRPGTTFEVVAVGDDEDMFGNSTYELVVERADGRGTEDDIPERDQDNWTLEGN